MGLIDDKKNIFTEVGAYISVSKTQNKTDNVNSFLSVNNKKEPIPFMLDLLTVTSGSESVKNVFGQIITKYTRTVTPSLKEELKKLNTLHNSNTTVAGDFTTVGYRASVKDIDIFGKYKDSPSNDVGKLLYNDLPTDFDRAAYNAIANPRTDVAFGNLLIQYSESTDEFIFKGANALQTKGDFIDSFIDTITIINEKELNSRILDSVYGNITSKSTDTNIKDIIEAEKYKKTIEKLLSEENEIDITNSELEEIIKKAEQKHSGTIEFQIGCCDCIDGSLSLEDTLDLLNVITGTNDPSLAGDIYEATINKSFTDPVQQDTKNQNIATIRDNFFKRLINNILQFLMEALTASPQMRAFQLVIAGFKNNNPVLDSPINELKKNKNIIDCLIKTIKESINKFIFDIVKKELVKLVSAVSRTIITEKINQFLLILKSLI